MDRQLFSQTSRVSTRRNGAVPVSVALHVIAIGSAVLASAAMMPPLPAVEPPPPNIPVVFVPRPVRVEPVPPPPPKGPRNAGSTRRPPAAVQPQGPPPVVTVPNPAQVTEDLTKLVDPGPGTIIGAVGSEAVTCPECPIGPVGPGKGPGAGGEPRRVHTGIDAPARIHFVKPDYPRIAIMAGVQGEVTLDCVIGPDGKVYEAKILSGNPLLQQPALDAVRQWRYTRPRLNDTPISVLLTVTVKFGLQR